MGECERGGDGGEQDQATAASVAHASTGYAKGRIATTSGTRSDTESPATDRIADARLAKIDPERPKVDGFAVEKAHLKEVEG